MKTLKIIYSLATIFSIIYGFPMAIVSIGKDLKMFYIHLALGIFGLVLLLIAAIYLFINKKKTK